jgi:hypothetical protein
MIAGLLMITALRIGPRAAQGAVRYLGQTVALVVTLQLALPLGLLALLWAAGLSGSTAALIIVLTTAAPALSGSPNLALILGLDAARMMQIMIIGTAVFPITIVPVMLCLPELGDQGTTVDAAARLLGVIGASVGAGFALRALFLARPTAAQVKSLDGLSVLAFSAIVIALMAALRPALAQSPVQVAGWMALAFGLCYGLQILTVRVLQRGPLAPLCGPIALGAGNRNIALLLVALPPDTLTPILAFVACWQVPMYLTPILLKPLYDARTPS